MTIESQEFLTFHQKNNEYLNICQNNDKVLYSKIFDF